MGNEEIEWFINFFFCLSPFVGYEKMYVCGRTRHPADTTTSQLDILFYRCYTDDKVPVTLLIQTERTWHQNSSEYITVHCE
jgi:hypothetical protein